MSKNPNRVAVGLATAEKRWGHDPTAPRVVKMDDLSADQRRLVMALIEAQRSANAKAAS